MAKDINPKCKQCRRAGEKLFLKGERCYSVKCALIKRNYPPGFHGPKGAGRLTDYGLQLKEKQKAKRQYGILEKQFKLIFEKAKRQSGNTVDNFLRLLELRLDNVVFRLGLADSHPQARQIVNHGLIMVNNKKTDIPSFNLKVGDIIKVKPNKTRLNLLKSILEKQNKKQIPSWLHFDQEKMEAKVISLPNLEEIKPNFNAQMIIEYYSK